MRDWHDIASASTMHRLGLSLRRVGLVWHAKILHKHALYIKEAVLEPNDRSVADTLHELSRCERLMGQQEEAEALLQRAVTIDEANQGV